MKKIIKSQVTIPSAKIREILARIASQGVGNGDPDKLIFDVGEPTDSYGFIESGPVVLKGAEITIIGHPINHEGMIVTPETTIEFEKEEIADLIAEHVSKTMSAAVEAKDVQFSTTSRHQGDHGYEGPFLNHAVVMVKTASKEDQ